ncbi:MAG: hypothetical protein ACP5XB_10535 [Isosphaeraceae bacterium]
MSAGGLLLIIALAGLWLAGRALALKVTADRRLALFLSPGLGAACWLIFVHLTARWTGSFWTGLEVGTVFVVTIGVGCWLDLEGSRAIRFGRAKLLLSLSSPQARPPKGETAPEIADGIVRAWSGDSRGKQTDGTALTAHGSAWPMILSATLATAVIAPMTLGWAWHDEQLYTGHTGIISQIQNGHYPPRHMTFPDLEYRYHYGLDLAAAALASALGVAPGVAIDMLTLSSWWYTWCLLWLLGDRLLGPGRGWITAVITLFGGGLPFLLAVQDGYYVARLVMICEAGGVDLNPPVISYFFQHPWALGLPLALCTMLIVLDRRNPRPGRYLSLAVLLCALTISQVVVFASMAGAVFVAEVFSSGRLEWRRIPGVATALAVALLAGKAGAGFFLPPPDQMGLGLALHAGVTSSLWSTLVWHTLTYGLLLPLGIAGLFLLHRGRLLLTLLLAGSLVVLNFVVYAHSWDIVKFGAIAALAFSILGSAAMARVFAIRPVLLGASLGTLLLAAVTADGLAFPILFALDAQGIPLAMYPKVASKPPSESDKQAIAWLRHRVPPGDLVYRLPVAALAYDHRGGLSVPWFDGLTDTFGFSRERLERRSRLLVTPSPDPARYDAEGIRWFVLGPGDAVLSRYAEEWIKNRRATLEKRFGPLRIIRLIR